MLRRSLWSRCCTVRMRTRRRWRVMSSTSASTLASASSIPSCRSCLRSCSSDCPVALMASHPACVWHPTQSHGRWATPHPHPQSHGRWATPTPIPRATAGERPPEPPPELWQVSHPTPMASEPPHPHDKWANLTPRAATGESPSELRQNPPPPEPLQMNHPHQLSHPTPNSSCPSLPVCTAVLRLL